jgi:hypothetical protein
MMIRLLFVLALLSASTSLSAQVDLTINTNANATTCNIQNDTLYAFARIVNQGLTVAGNFSVGFYLTADITTDPSSDHLVGSVNVGTVAGGGITDVQIAVALTDINGVPDGTYYLGVYADDLFQKTETDENNNGFTMTSHSQLMFPLSLVIAGYELPLNVSIYPNPVVDVSTIKFVGQERHTYTIIIYDALGIAIRQKYFTGGQDITIERGSESNGLYFFVIQDRNENIVSTGKLILFK